ncbi:DUF3086 domain-containing protein [[Limnothrix rosea] IAM M-220]|uniref:DUF3086 domain-containing protein n=1 Tax=[Limnothrix rosea] IAM M-220 TaxID=454133 RepID=UPI00095F5CFC|nr:DUF3086 domain-containing protein [[Limnothrix rosea] IAM M-220]OKH15094.1 hypothetical protein NIES208_13395 [[Limnothrix rosea] IAM M-220]
MSSDPQDRPKLDLKPAPPQPLDIPAIDQTEAAKDSTPAEAIADSVTPEEPTLTPEFQAIQADITVLERQKAALVEEIAALKKEKNSLFNEQTGGLETQVQQFMAKSLQTLEAKQTALQKSVDQLERRRDRIREEMRTTFAGASQDIAVRVQGFRDYLMGSLQDLVMAAEQLDFPSYDDNWSQAATPVPPSEPIKQKLEPPQFAKKNFAARVQHIEATLKQYQMSPDYYGPPWQLRRTFEPIHSDRVKKWFFEQGGRGAVRSMGSRLQNILVASAGLSVLYNMYGDRLRALILANTPERLGEWRRGLQDCLGISRSDFGPNSGVILFENPDALVQKADRLVEDDKLPLIIIDEAEDNISLSLLQYQLWLAFAPEPQSDSSYFF